MGKQRHLTRAVVYILVVALTATPLITQATTGRYLGNTPCVEVTGSPPSAYVGECGPTMIASMASSSPAEDAAVDIEAHAQGPHVLVSWDVDDKVADVAAFHLYKGSNPEDMEALATLDPDSDEHLDELALVTSPGAWYRVVAETADGNYTSPATQVDLTSAAIG